MAITDWSSAADLAQRYPVSFRGSQDLLVASKKLLAGPGWFRSERSLIQRLQAACYALDRALKGEGFMPEAGGKERLAAWLKVLPDVFPNWQAEYRQLNDFLRLIY